MPAPTIDSRAAHTLDARQIQALTPHLPQEDLREIRQAWAAFLDNRRTPGQPYTTWQDAWNAFTGATRHRSGQITYRTARCSQCRGRGYDTRHITRNLTRTGHPYACGTCGGNRGGQTRTQTALHARPPREDA